MEPKPTGVLRGVRVLELGQVLAGPFAGAILADLGADVIKVERVQGGDDARQMGPAFRHGDAINFHIFNRGKRSVALDLKSPVGLAAFEQLAAEADIFIHNMRPGVPQSMGIDGPRLCARHPRLIYCEISAFGHVGPMAMRPGYEPLIQAFSGLSSTNGGPDDPPMRSGASMCDMGSGMWAVIGALAMLQQRQSTGRGGIVSTSLLETALAWNGQKADAYVNEGRLPKRRSLPLGECPPGSRVRLVAVKDGSDTLLQLLGQKGLRIGMRMKVAARESFDASMEVVIGRSTRQVLSRQVAAQLLVEPAVPAKPK